MINIKRLGIAVFWIGVLVVSFFAIRDVVNIIKNWGGKVVTEENQKLKENEKGSLSIKKGIVTVKTKNKDGQTIEKKTFVPQEGSVEATQDNDGTVQLSIKNKGFCFSPGVGVFGTSNLEMSVALDSKFLYLGRYGMGIGFSTHEMYFWGSRHIDDWTKGYFNNVEVVIGAGRKYNLVENSVLAGIRVGF